MKIVITCFLLLLLSSAIAQPVLTSSDLPQVGEQFIITNAVVDGSVDPEATGANVIWDFSALQPSASIGDTFDNTSIIPILYQAFFLGSNLVSHNGQGLVFSSLTIDNVYSIFKTSGSSFLSSGYLGDLDGVTIPIIYNPKDQVYKLPISYGQSDSADASVLTDIPGVIFLSQQRHRANYADGYGTVKTPAGTFTALRVKSTITDDDSIYIASLGFGIALNLTSYEYKWLANGEGDPVFQINAQDVLGIPVVSTIQYKDSAFFNTIAPVDDHSALLLFPNPSNGIIWIQNNEAKKLEWKVFNQIGQLIESKSTNNELTTVNLLQYPNGVYIFQLNTNDHLEMKKLLLMH